MKKNWCKVHGEMNEDNAYSCKNPNGTIRLRCKACCNIRQKNSYLNNGDVRRKEATRRATEWKRNNRDRVKEWVREDKAKTPEKYRKWQSDHYKRNPSGYLDRTIAGRLKVNIDSYKQMFVDQNNKCAICNQEEIRQFKGKQMRLCLDHDHETGQIRQLLCHDCNTGIGKFKDTPELLLMAVDYLIKHKGWTE